MLITFCHTDLKLYFLGLSVSSVETNFPLFHVEIIIYSFLSTSQTLDAPTLQNLSFTVKPGQLLAVIGPVGAGKVCHNNFILSFHFSRFAI